MARNESTLACSFCGKRRFEVRKLIAGPTVYICNECIDLCNDIIYEDESMGVTPQKRLLVRHPDLDRLTPVEFLRTHMGGRPTDSTTMGDMLKVYAAVATLLRASKKQALEPDDADVRAAIEAERRRLDEEAAELAAEERWRQGTPIADLPDDLPEHADLEGLEIDPEVLALIPREVCEKHCIIPLRLRRQAAYAILFVASRTIGEPFVRTLTHLEIDSNYSVVPLLAKETDIRAAIRREYGKLEKK